jgi:hypothetical protein
MGKTSAFAKRIANFNTNKRIEVYVPTNALAIEWKALINNFNPTRRVKIISGRNHMQPSGEPLCKRHQLATQLSQSGLSVYSRLCRISELEKCHHYFRCPYIAQFDYADVFIYTHAHLSLDRGMLELRVPGIVIIDEAFALACLQKIEFNISLLRHQSLPTAAVALCTEIANLLQSGDSLYRLITNACKRGGGYHSAVDSLRATAPNLNPDQSDNILQQTLNSALNFEPVAKLLEHLRQAFSAKSILQSVDFDADTGQITVHHRNDITRFKPKSTIHQPPQIYLLDATASREITEIFFPEADYVEYRARRNACVVQCRSSKVSKRSINPDAHIDSKAKSDAAQRLTEIQKLINELSSNGKKLLVVGPTAIAGNPKSNIPPIVHVPPHSALAHFSALRGVDAWKDFDATLIISRNEPPINAVQDLARALFYDAAEPLQLTDSWVPQARAYQVKSEPEGVEVDCHPDNRAQAILVQLRESESLQAIDRLRLIHCKETKLVVILSNIPLDIEVDHLLTWEELIHGNRLEKALLTADVVIPLEPKWLSHNYNHLWATPDAAKKDVQRTTKKGQITNRYSIYKMSLFTFEYRAKNQRRSSYCLSKVDDPVIVSEELSALLGYDVFVTRPQPAVAQPLSPPTTPHPSSAPSAAFLPTPLT